MIVTCWDHSMTNNQGREIFSTRQGTSFCLPAVPLSWVSPAQVCWLSLWAVHIPGPPPPTPPRTSAAGDALFTFAPDLINSVSAGARGSSRRAQPHWSGHQTSQEGAEMPSQVPASSQTSLLPLQENECVSSMQSSMIICKYESCYHVYFPSMFSHPDLWLSARDLSEAVPGIACRWKLYQRNVSSISSTKNPRKSKWEEV